MINFLLALFYTVSIELIVLFWYFIFTKKIYFGLKNISFIGALASILTLPFLYFVFPIFFDISGNIIYFLEILITIIEAIWYKYMFKISYKEGFLISFLCNSISYGFGLIFF